MKAMFRKWWIKFLSSIDFKSHVEDQELITMKWVKKSKKCALIALSILILIGMFYLVYFIGSRFLYDGSETKAIYIYPQTQASVTYPYDNLKTFIETANRCILLKEYSELDTRELITIERNAKTWSMMNITDMFVMMEKKMIQDSELGIYVICSTMIGLQHMPCGCVSRLENNTILWILSIDSEHFSSNDRYIKRDLASIRERTFMFSSMKDAVITKVVPKKMECKIVVCSKTKDRLSCKASIKTIEGRDVLVLYRTWYYMNVDSRSYSLSHPEFGKIEWDDLR
jgi:hypothetical protein